MQRLLSAALTATLLCVLPSVSALAQQFPSKPVRMVIPWTAGGSTDVLGRALANELSKTWGQPVVVENPAGAGSVIGAERVANSAPDGYTLMMTIDTTTVHNRFLYKLPYDPDKSFTPITMVARSGQFIIKNPDFPAKNLRELVDYARKNPNKVAYATYGQGSQPELFFEAVGKREGVQFLKVPYKGVADCVMATVKGEVQATISSPAASGTQVKAGKATPIAIGGAQRTSLFPNVPTISESGFPYADAGIWFGLFAPAGLNAQLVDRIHRDTIAVIKRPDFIEKFIKGFSLNLVGNTPAEFTASIASDVKMISEMVKASGLKPQ